MDYVQPETSICNEHLLRYQEFIQCLMTQETVLIRLDILKRLLENYKKRFLIRIVFQIYLTQYKDINSPYLAPFHPVGSITIE